MCCDMVRSCTVRFIIVVFTFLQATVSLYRHYSNCWREDRDRVYRPVLWTAATDVTEGGRKGAPEAAV